MPTGSYNESESKLKQSSTLSHMTIPQLNRAQKILEEKLKDKNLDEFTKSKLERMLSRYVKAQYIINKHWKKTYNKQPGVTARNRNTLTLLDVYKGKAKGLAKHEGANGYNVIDMFNDVKGVALGVGVTAISIGAANSIAQAFGTSLPTLLKTAMDWLGPVNSSLLLGGAALVVAAKVIPAIRRKADQMRNHRKYAQDLQNELTDEIHNNLDGFDPSLLDAKNYASNKDYVVQTLFDNYKTLAGYYTSLLNNPNSELNNTQRKNLREALAEAQEKFNEFEAENGEFNPETAQMAAVRKERAKLEAEKEALKKDKEEFETTKGAADKSAEDYANELAAREKEIAKRERNVAEAEKRVEQQQSQVDSRNSRQSAVNKANKRANAAEAARDAEIQKAKAAEEAKKSAETARDAATQRANDAENRAKTAEEKAAEESRKRQAAEQASADKDARIKQLEEAAKAKNNESTPHAKTETPPAKEQTSFGTPEFDNFMKIFAEKVDYISQNELNAMFSEIVNKNEIYGMKLSEESKQEILSCIKAIQGYSKGKGKGGKDKIQKANQAIEAYQSKLLADKGEEILEAAAKGE